MQATELMIGDWVFLPAYNINARVRSIGEPYMDGHRQLTLEGQHGGIYSSISAEHVSPIDLTDKILCKAGFEQTANIFEYSFHHRSLMILIGSDSNYRWPTEEITDNPINLQFVHELQHAMQLASIDNQFET